MKTISIQEIQPESYFIASCAPCPGLLRKVSWMKIIYLLRDRASQHQNDRQTDRQTARKGGVVAGNAMRTLFSLLT